MSSKNVNAKNASNAKEIKTPAKIEKKIDQFNLDQFADRLKDLQIKEKKDRETIYIYPEGKGKDWINSEEGKRFRNKMRSTRIKFSNNILIYAKMQDQEKLKSEIEKFMEFYKINYRNNDLSIGSLSQSNDAGKEKDLSLALEIIKGFQSL